MNIQDMVLTLRSGLGSGASTGTVVVVAVVLMLIVFLLGAILYFVYQQTPRGRIDALLDSRAEGRTSSKWPIRIAVLVLFATALFGVRYAMNRPAACAQCHESSFSTSLAETTHQDVSCLSCHGGSGVTADLQSAVSYGRWILVYTATKQAPEPQGARVGDSQCLSCHSAVRRGLVERNGIRVRHTDFLDQGAHCRDCHNKVGHGEASREPTEPGMDDCVPCHDGETASSECETCHVKDALEAAALSGRKASVKTADSGNCYACHDEAPCLRCHGITMPHPQGWAPGDSGPGISGSHAREGFTDRELCWRCHYSNGQPFVRPATNGGFSQTTDGCTCHGSFGNMHGGEAWVKEHGLQASGQKTGAESECFMCHDARYLCDQCHDPSMKERYNPQSGPDNYTRSIPKPEGYWEY